MSATVERRITSGAGVGSLLNRMAVPAIVAVILVMLIVPLSPVAISLMFALNISIGLVILAAAIYIPQPAEFLSFPSILLGTTLMRLSLNVATARAILLNGYTGTDAAGSVIQSFGQFVVGGDYIVGFIIFGILVTINLVVVTKGSSRVAEVSARFMLDSLPGRQMAIDADVHAGAITAKDAEHRRDLLRREADFFGSMDGASKFVRGDAIAAMIILFVNLIGGLLIGTLQHDLPIGVATQTYTLLTIGDGVAAQIPSLAISIAAGLIVTRVATGEDLSAQVISQVSRYPQAILVAAGLLIALGLLPGMAHFPFLLLGGILCFVSLRLRQTAKRKAGAAAATAAAKPTTAQAQARLDAASVQRIDAFGLEIGFALVSLLDAQPDQRPSLLDRLTGVRTRYSRRMGFVLPNIHIRDADKVKPQEYRFTIRGGVIGTGEVVPGQLLAIEDDVIEKLDVGKVVREPAGGQPARWIDPQRANDAELRGYTVVDPAAVIATHLETLLRAHGAELLGRREIDDIIGVLGKAQPKLADDLRTKCQMGVVRHVLASLVEEGIPVTDFERIADALVEMPDAAVRDAEEALAYVRSRLARQIVSQFLAADHKLRVMILDPEFEVVVMKAIDANRDPGAAGIVEPTIARLLRTAALQGRSAADRMRARPVLAVASKYRRPIARTLRGIAPVIAIQEIPDTQAIEPYTIRPPESDAHGQSASAG